MLHTLPPGTAFFSEIRVVRISALVVQLMQDAIGKPKRNVTPALPDTCIKGFVQGQ